MDWRQWGRCLVGFARRHWQLGLMIGLVLAFTAITVLLPMDKQVIGWLDVVRHLGWWAPVILGLTYILGAVFFFPPTPLNMASGFMFGVWWGTAVASISTLVGAVAAYGLSHIVTRSWITRRLKDYPKLSALQRAVHHDAFLIVFLSRVAIFIPYNLLNYAFGLFRVRFRTFLLATWVGMLPGTLMYVYLGSGAQSLARIVHGGFQDNPLQHVMFVGGMVLTVAVTLLVTYKAQKELEQRIEEEDA